MSVLYLIIMNFLVVQVCTDVQMLKKGREIKGRYNSTKELTWDVFDMWIWLGGKEPSAHKAWSHEGVFKMKRLSSIWQLGRWEHAVLGCTALEFMNHVSGMNDCSPWNYALSKKVFENPSARFIFMCCSITFLKSFVTVGGFHRKSLTEETWLIKIWNTVL